MAITAKFEADFSSFTNSVRDAEVRLDAMKSGSDNVSASLTRMVNSFSGQKIVSDATLMAEVFDRAGGAAKFTTAELAKMAATGQEAAEKLSRMGLEVPQGIQRIADASGTAAPQVNTLQGSLSTFDSVLQAAGIHIGPEIRAIGEIGQASGKSASELGLIATAGLAVGTAFAAFKLTSAILEFTGLDKAIADTTARLYDFGIARETAGAKQDTIDRAIKAGADNMISYSDAIAFNKTHQTEWMTQTERSAEVVARWRGEIEKVQAKGDLAQLSADLASQNFQLKDLAARYNISVEALQFMNRETANANAASKERLAALKAEEDAIRRHAEELKKALAEEDRVTMDVYNRRIRTLNELTQANLKAYSLEGQIANLHALEAAEESLTRQVYNSLTSERDRMKIIEDFNKRRTELLTQEAALETKLAVQKQGQQIAELNAQAQILAAYGQNVDGTLKVTSAAETLRVKLDELHRQKVEGISQYAQEQVLMDAYTKALYDEAVAEDKAAESAAKHVGELGKIPAAASAAQAAITSLNNILVPTGESLDKAGIIASTITQGGPGPGATPLPWGGGRGVVATGGTNIYVTQPLGTPDAIAKAVDAALTARQQNTGQRMPFSS